MTRIGDPPHEWPLLGAYSLGCLDPDEAEATRRHLASCPQCRLALAEYEEVRTALGSLPAEVFADGPPADASLLLQRTLRQARRESARPALPRTVVAVASALILVAIGLGVGVLVGGRPATNPQAAVTVTPAPSGTPLPPGAKTLDGADPATGAHLVASVVPAQGWVRLQVEATGIRPGEQCQLVVLSREGQRQVAGSWLAPAQARQSQVSVNGSALVAPSDVTAVQVVDLATGAVLVKADA